MGVIGTGFKTLQDAAASSRQVVGDAVPRIEIPDAVNIVAFCRSPE